MKHHTYRRLSALALTALSALSLTGCTQQTEETVMDPTITVETAAVQRGSLSADGSYIGTISAEGTAQVIALVSGEVEEIGVSVGDTVQAGDFLCRIDDESAQINLSSAQASYRSALTAVQSAEAGMVSAQAGVQSAQAGAEQAQAAVNSAQESYKGALAQYGGSEGSDALPVLEEQVKMAEDNYENTKALFDIGAASQIEVDQAYQTMLSAQAGLEAAKAGLSTAQAGVSQAQSGISSAQAGAASAQAGVQSAQAGMTQAQAGVEAAKVGVAAAEYQLSLYNLTAPISGVVEAVNVTENNFAASGSPVFVISNGSNKTVTFYVTDEIRHTLKPGQSVTVTSGGRAYQGAVTEISGVVDAAVGLFKIKAVIEDAQDLPDGLAVELTTAAYAAQDAILVPSDALYFEDGNAYVYVAQEGQAVRKSVTVGLSTADTIALTDGLSEGDQVITSWSAALKDGSPIRLGAEE